MGYGYSGANIQVEIENTYEYAGREFDDWEGLTNYLNYNLNMHKNIDDYATDIEAIADEAVELAREFIEENGTYESGELWHSVNWRPIYHGIQLYADAVDDYDRHYAGHIEYGFTDKAGMPHGPWPFLRPAMRIAAEMSTGRLADHMASDILYGYGNTSFLQFGRANLNNVAREAGGRYAIRDRVRNQYGAKNKVDHLLGHSKQNMGLQNKYRWTTAGHGVNFKGKISPDIKESFDAKWGSHLREYEFRGGYL